MHTLLQYCTPRIYPVLLLFYSKKEMKNSKSVAFRTPTVAWCRDRGPVINIVGWEPGWEAREATLVINGVARQ